MSVYPREPAEPQSLVSEERTPLRYEDISQDGRMRLEGVWAPTGRLLWSGSDVGRRMFRLGRDHGIRTVLTHAVLEATEVVLQPRVQVDHALRHRFEQVPDDSGGASAIYLNTWLTTCLVERGNATATDGASRRVARAYGQRLLARLDHPPGQRRVTRLPGPEFEAVPLVAGERHDPHELLRAPPGSELIEPAPRLDASRVVFGLSHTDSNHHVNFLAYARFFEGAGLGRLLDLGLGAVFMARRVELGYRQPCFAGECLRIALQFARLDDYLVAMLALVDPTDGPLERASFSSFGPPRCTARMWFLPARG